MKGYRKYLKENFEQETFKSLGLDWYLRVNKLELPDDLFDDPKIQWFRNEQNTEELYPTEPKSSAKWGEGIVAIFPDGKWTYYRANYDSSG